MKYSNNLKRWDGWGREGVDLKLSAKGWVLLRQKLGEAVCLESPTLEEVLQTVPVSRFENSRLSTLSYVNLDAETRLRHTRGQGFCDWLALKSGQFQSFPEGVTFPDAVAFPESSEQVQSLLQLAQSEDFNIIPYGGGTSNAGHINPRRCLKPVLTVSLGRMNRLLDFDKQVRVATFGAGVCGPQLESQLRQMGYTLGHYPQSFEYSTAGGWVASRASGQQALKYGRIEQLFLGGRIETLYGSLKLPVISAKAIDPSLKEQVLGSEGRLGVITEVQFKVMPLPESETFYPVFFPSWQQGLQAAKALSQSGLALSMVRLSLPAETEMQMVLADCENKISWLERYFYRRVQREGGCLMLLGITGTLAMTHSTWVNAWSLLKAFKAFKAPQVLGTAWSEGRFRFPYLREQLWQAGYAIDTIEISALWSEVEAVLMRIETRLRMAAQQYQHSLHVVSYLSDVYPQGSNLCVTYLFPVGADYQTGYERWLNLQEAAARALAQQGATVDTPYLCQESGALEDRVMARRFRFLDPDARLNPGALPTPDDELRA